MRINTLSANPNYTRLLYVAHIFINRNELNSGWLITDIARNEYGITEFIKNLK